ncbi:ABC transporter ATP-binding protein [Caldalkalibacillus salinus]|uniref:ABC transporter ATP-binding protein n=1 Tax=Caldalkalibacillus salinus TaxID=2803787 RepID=UPI0019228726|nr:ABC transporter ATP-binding protein [Caldalkalibacillus salinus]
MLTVKNLSKAIDNELIFDNVNFSIKKGSIVGLLGRNGVGKTTLLKTMMGIIDPDQGDVHIDNQSILDHPRVKTRMAYVPDSTEVLKHYTIQELQQWYADIYPAFDEQKFYQLLKRFELPNNGRLRKFSKGMKASFFVALVASTMTDVILLDEPTNGLDPIIKKNILQFLLEEVSEREVSLVISTHHLHEIEKAADTVLLMKGTTLAKQINLDDISREYAKLQVVLSNNTREVLENIEGVHVLSEVGRVTTVLLQGNTEYIRNQIRKHDPILMDELSISLEDIYTTHLGGDDHVV